jgi:hypothetical protein
MREYNELQAVNDDATLSRERAKLASFIQRNATLAQKQQSKVRVF